MFLQAVDKNFPKGSPLAKYFNRASLKMSYSTVKNMKDYISSHNRKLLQPKEVEDKLPCKCDKYKHVKECPLPGDCRTKGLVYESHVTSENKAMVYAGQTEREFIVRYKEHEEAIRNENSSNSTALSRYIWDLKKNKKSYTIEWKVKSRAPTFKAGSKRCMLCIREKVAIATRKPSTLINSRSELLSKCMHEADFELQYYTPQYKTRKKRTRGGRR